MTRTGSNRSAYWELREKITAVLLLSFLLAPSRRKDRIVLQLKDVFGQYIITFAKDLSWLLDNRHTIQLCLSGSKAYGMSTPQSDTDIKGVAIPPKEFVLGVKVFEQAEFKSALAEGCVYALSKYVHLAAENNPNILEQLFIDPADILHQNEELWGPFVNIRQSFLSKRCKHTYSGYALSQVKRLKSHRLWLLCPRQEKPTRAEFGLPETTLIPSDQLAALEAAVRKQMDSWALDLSDLDDARRIYLLGQVERVLVERCATSPEEQAVRLLSVDTSVTAVLKAERAYASALRQHQQYCEWQRSRNPVRAELEAKYGYDCKHASHTVRLLRTCREILTDHKLLVKRPDAEELLAIRNGAWSYDQLIEYVEREDAAMVDVMNASTLPRSPDLVRINAVLTDVLMTSLTSR